MFSSIHDWADDLKQTYIAISQNNHLSLIFLFTLPVKGQGYDEKARSLAMFSSSSLLVNRSKHDDKIMLFSLISLTISPWIDQQKKRWKNTLNVYYFQWNQSDLLFLAHLRSSLLSWFVFLTARCAFSLSCICLLRSKFAFLFISFYNNQKKGIERNKKKLSLPSTVALSSNPRQTKKE